MKSNFKKICILLLTSCLLLSLCSCSSAKLELKSQEVEADKTLKLTDIVTLSDTENYTVQASEESANIDLGKPGEYTAKYIIKKNGADKETEKELSFKVIDTTAPTIGAAEVIALAENEFDDIENALEITDNSSDEVEVDINGDYDLSKAGTYNIKVTAKDSSGNESKKDVEVVIKKGSEDETTSSNSGSSAKLGSLAGYWVNKPGNKFFLIKSDNGTDIIIADALKSGPGGGGLSGEIKSISTSGDTTTLKYKDYDDNKTYSLKLKIQDNSSLNVTSKNNLSGTYQKWSESQINNYWKSLGF